MRELIGRPKNYIITSAVAACMAVLIMIFEIIKFGGFTANASRIISDMFSITGLVLTVIGVLIFAVNAGEYYMFGYMWYRFTKFFDKNKRKQIDQPYQDYIKSRQDMPKTHYMHLLVVGIVFVVIGIIILVTTGQI